ncbi:MAG: ammonium transporter [Jiangellales bacterium]
MEDFSAGDTAFILISAAMVLLMTPGLAFFYGGMTRAKSVLNMMMMSFIALATVPVVWVLWGYSMAFGGEGAFIGGFDLVGMSGMTADSFDQGLTIPDFAFSGFQMMFAIITVALISGAIADRAKFGTWALFTVLWVTLVYFPVAHNVWGGGWIRETLDPIDFAGGTAVHINAGAAALALVFVLGRRIGFRKDPMRPHNLPFVVLGAALLWFGWFGFNAGSELAADGVASVMLLNTTVATAAAILGWLVVELVRDKAATTLGAASGAIAGLVAITPSGANVSPLGAIALGAVAGIVCALAVGLKYKLGYDDSLDVVGVHLVGGLVGSILVGVLASETFGGIAASGDLLARQTAAALIVLAYSFIVTYILGTLLDKTIGFRIKEEDEIAGIDMTTHAETAYEFFNTGGSLTKSGHASASAPAEGKVNA